jgi:Kef-type K+ transport system membrane component KefB
MGMVPRGEVGVVVASLGLAAGVFTPEMYAVIVAMSLLTSILTPPLLGTLLRRAHQPEDGDRPGAARDSDL